MKFMNKNSLYLLLFLVLMMSMVQYTASTDVTPNSPLVQIDESRITPATYLDHEPIWVDGNDDFTTQAAAESWPGDGSEGNPFIIAGYHILTTTTNPFKIWNTDLFWEIRGNNVTTNSVFCGTWITGTTQGVIAENIFHDLHSGMVIGVVANLTIEDNGIRDTTADGIEVLNDLNNCTIRNNDIHNIAGAGIVIPDAEDVLIHNNIISETGGHGIHIKAGVNNTIQDNEISQISVHGIKIDRNCHESTIRNNIILSTSDGINCVGDFNEFYQNTIRDSSGTGIKVEYVETTSSISINNTFSDNTIINCSEYSVDIAEQSSDNIFTGNDFFESGNSVHVNDDGDDNTFSKNFYDTWISPDEDSDGYVDSPYIIDGDAENQDALPLAEPSNQLPEDYVYTPISDTSDSSTSEPDPGADLVPVAVIAAVLTVMITVIIVIKKKG